MTKNKVYVFLVAFVIVFVAAVNVLTVSRDAPGVFHTTLETLEASAFYPPAFEDGVIGSGRVQMCCMYYCCVSWRTDMNECSEEMAAGYWVNPNTATVQDPSPGSGDTHIFDCYELNALASLYYQATRYPEPPMFGVHEDYHHYLSQTGIP